MQIAQLQLPGNDPQGNPTTFVVQGPSGLKFNSLGDVISDLIPLLLTFASIMLFLYLIWGGFDYLLSGGDPQKMESGKTKIVNALIGFFVVFVSYFLTQLIARIFGVPLF